MNKGKTREFPLLGDLYSMIELNNSYEKENSWLIEILTIAAENYSYKTSEYEEKIILLKNNPLHGLSRGDLFWLADKFARVFARVKYRSDYYYYHRYFFSIFFGKERKKYPNNLFWNTSYCKRQEKKVLETANPKDPIFFNSGASTVTDYLAYSLANKPVGVQIGLCSERVKELILNYNNRECRTFLDSGAFSAFRKGQQVDFPKVFKDYFNLVEKAEKPSLLTLVAPDIIGSQEASLTLLKEYKKEIYRLICLGVDLIIPIQLGNLSLEEAYNKAVAILSTKAFRIGLPSNEKAISLDRAFELVSNLQPKSIHFLGLRHTRFDYVVGQIKTISPNTHISADATTLRAKLKKGSKLLNLIEIRTKQAVEEALSKGTNFISYETLVNKVLHQPSFLSENQAKHLARLISPLEEEQERIIKIALSGIRGIHNGSRLGDFFSKFYDEEIVSQALQQFAQNLARRAVSGSIRTNAIAEVA